MLSQEKIENYLITQASREHDELLPSNADAYRILCDNTREDISVIESLIEECKRLANPALNRELKWLSFLKAQYQIAQSFEKYASLLMEEPIGYGYSYADYHLGMAQLEKVKDQEELERQKNIASSKHDEAFISLKKQVDIISQSLLGTNYIEMYENKNSFFYSDYKDDAMSILSSTKEQYASFITPLRDEYPHLSKIHIKNFFRKGKTTTKVNNRSIWDKLIFDFVSLYPQIKVEMFADTFGFENWGAACVPIQIPSDIRIVFFSATPFFKSLCYLMHEIGHGIAFAETSPSLDFISKYDYNEIVQETYAYIFEYLPYNEYFRKKYDISYNNSTWQDIVFESLYKKRILAVKFLYQDIFFRTSSNVSGLKETYKEMMEQALLFNFDQATYSVDADIGRLNAQLFVSSVLGEKIICDLVDKFDLNWFEKPSAVCHLRKFWQEGGNITPKDLLDLQSKRNRRG